MADSAKIHISVGSIEDFLRGRLRAALPGARAHARFAPRPLSPDRAPGAPPETARRAAALILLYPGARGVSVPLTERDASLPTHAGQISLPGGAIDAGESITAAALREAHEEIGVPPRDVRVLGALSPVWIAVSGFLVTPVVGVADARPAFAPRPGEVSTIIEAPLAHLRDRAHVHWGRRDRGGEPVDYPFIDLDGHVVWGATAMMLAELACLFDPDHAPPPR